MNRLVLSSDNVHWEEVLSVVQRLLLAVYFLTRRSMVVPCSETPRSRVSEFLIFGGFVVLDSHVGFPWELVSGREGSFL